MSGKTCPDCTCAEQCTKVGWCLVSGGALEPRGPVDVARMVDVEKEAPQPERIAKVIPFNGITRLDLDADRVLEGAKGEVAGVVLLGWDKAGEMYFASTYADGGTVLWLLEQCKLRLLNVKG